MTQPQPYRITTRSRFLPGIFLVDQDKLALDDPIERRCTHDKVGSSGL